MNKGVFLLAPGGSFEMAKQAFLNGADGVYVGLYGWSRRTKEYELKMEEIERIVILAEDLGKKVRVALNTAFSSLEYHMFRHSIKRLSDIGVHGVILNDAGAVVVVKEIDPSMEVHISAGMNAINIEDMWFYRELGADMVVAPCNLKLDEIREIKKLIPIGIEVFLHSNTCFTYLGKCLMSSYFRYEWSLDEYGKNHFLGSPNRGGYCHRICKANWFSEKGKVILRNDMFLAFDSLEDWIDAGVDCLKIQGREYNPSLVGEIVRFYRQVLDEILTHGFIPDKDRFKRRLLELSEKRDRERNRRTFKVLEELAEGSSVSL